jgi:CubicO group peptidase (beta-lactamase class C family)
MTQASNETVRKAMDVAINERGELGIQVAAYANGKQVVDVWTGVADDTTGTKVNADTVFPVFSVSKAIAATALHIQAERGLVDYYEPISKYWPEFAAHGKGKATVYDALTHRVGVPLLPLETTVERMCDWDWMVQQIADMRPLYQVGTMSSYLAYTFGWVIGEVVRRTDPKDRPFGAFVQEELCQPLGIDSLWVGIPPEVEPRVGRLTNIPAPPPGAPGMAPDSLMPRAILPDVGITQEVFGRSDVRRACIPGVNGIMNARSLARFFAMLANGGELDGVRLLSKNRVRTFNVRRPPVEYDWILGEPHMGSIGGYYLAGTHMVTAGSSPTMFGHIGAGGSIGWADPESNTAVAITHNRMYSVPPEEDPFVPLGKAVRQVIGAEG